MISLGFWNYLHPVLDRVRKHAGSWMIKTVLTMIILSFIFFFGYQQVTSRNQDAASYAAFVGDEAIPRKKFENLFEITLTQFQENLNGAVPEEMERLLRQNVLNQMIMRELLVQYARKLGLTVSEEELASTIRSNRNLFPDGHFNLTAYERDFLPRYRQQYGEDYEYSVRRDLLVEKMGLLAVALFGPWQQELDLSLNKIRGSSKKEDRPPLEGLTISDLLDPWIDGFREKVQVEVFER